MAVRGVAVVTDMVGWQEDGRADVSVSYAGFQHTSETAALNISVVPSLLTGAALKAAVLAKVEEWYGANPSEDYDEWDDTPVVGDNLILIGGIL